MRKFDDTEIKKRQRLIEPCHRIYQLFKDKKITLGVFWPEAFEKGDVDRVAELFQKTSQIVDEQISAVNQIISLIKEQESKIKKQEEDVDKHTRYGKLTENHFTFQEAILNILHKEEPDIERLMQYFGFLKQDLERQKSLIDSVNKKGEGKQAYIETDLRELAKKEFEILNEIQPFWHDWELLALQLEKLTAQSGTVDDKQIDNIRDDVLRLLQGYHDEYTDNGRASQLGTEMAINLYLIPTQDIEKNKNKVPVTVINVDITAFNNLDGSHELGNVLIDVCYQELSKSFARDFIRSEDGSKMEGKGVVTILGRTRFKIIGVPFEELEVELPKLPVRVMEHVFRRQGKRFMGSNKENRFRALNTQLLAGYQDMDVGGDRDNFKSILTLLNLQRSGALENKIDIESMRNQLRTIEQAVAKKVHDSIKFAAAKAEYLEKKEVPRMKQERLELLQHLKKKEGIPDMITPIFEQRFKELEQKVFDKFPEVMVYGKGQKISKEWIGRNYIPEEEFEGRMVQRISHQIGFDLQRTREFFDAFYSLHSKNKAGDMTAEEAKKFQELKNQFYQEVLQSRQIAKSYDLRFTAALREEAYDEVLPKMMLVEGPQVMTFIELDGFNAFNKTYRPNSQDIFYHAVLQMMSEKFEYTFNKGFPEEQHMKLRMTKQGDEIWISYPLHPPRGMIGENQHKEFLEKIRLSLVERSGDNVLEIDNPNTVEWIPYLIEKRDDMERHMENSFRNNRLIRYVDNDLFKSTEKVSEQFKPAIVREQDGPVLLSRVFPKALFTGQKNILKQDQEDFSKWKVLDGARMITGHGLFGLDVLQYAYLLFNETVKLDVGGSSERAPTGRVIRLGTTMGYTGFKEHLIKNDSQEMNTTRKKLNDSIEELRKTKGRGGTYNLEA